MLPTLHHVRDTDGWSDGAEAEFAYCKNALLREEYDLDNEQSGINDVK